MVIVRNRGRSRLDIVGFYKKQHEQQKAKRIILAYLAKKDAPRWFRGLSHEQFEAIKYIPIAMRDDIDQETTHNMRKCLSILGLLPMVNSKQINTILYLCRGNDLAFMWFLMELYYKTDGPEYSINEQLIMTMIFFLDLIPMLRELDRILPPPQLTKKAYENRKKLKAHQQREQKRKRKEKRKNLEDYPTPYFAPLVRARRYGKPLTLKPPDYQVSFKAFESYKDPNYLQDNELNRWFADYQLGPKTNITNGSIHKNIHRYSSGVYGPNLQNKISAHLCTYHMKLQHLEHSLFDQLMNIAKDNCMKMLNKSTIEKEECVKQIANRLNEDIQQYMQRFKRLTRGGFSGSISYCVDKNCTFKPTKLKRGMGIPTLLSNATNNVKSDDNQIKLQQQEQKQQPQELHIDKELKHHVKQHVEIIGDYDRNTHMPVLENFSNNDKDDMIRKPTIGDCEHSSTTPILKHKNSSLSRVRLRRLRTYYCSKKRSAMAPESISTPSSSERYFHCLKPHHPCLFDYTKIFDFRKDEKNTVNIKCAIFYALGSKECLSFSEKAMKEQIVDKAIDNKINEFITHIFTTCKEKEKEKDDEIDESISPLGYKMKYYDPNDNELMERMLKDAIKYMQRNVRFVAPFIPDLHKMPILKEFIRQRFGKVYSLEDNRKEFKDSEKVFFAIQKHDIRVRIPNKKLLGTQKEMDYTCRDFLYKLSKELRRKYYHRLSLNILEQTRSMWLGMNAAQCSEDLGEIYFAYLPGRFSDITNYRQWRSHDFIDYAYYRRYHKKRLSNSF